MSDANNRLSDLCRKYDIADVPVLTPQDVTMLAKRALIEQIQPTLDDLHVYASLAECRQELDELERLWADAVNAVVDTAVATPVFALDDGSRVVAQMSGRGDATGIHIMRYTDTGDMSVIATIAVDEANKNAVEVRAWAAPDAPVYTRVLFTDEAGTNNDDVASISLSQADAYRIALVRRARPGDLIAYRACNESANVEIGRIVRRNTTDTGWFVCYSNGITPANTRDENLYPIENRAFVGELGGARFNEDGLPLW